MAGSKRQQVLIFGDPLYCFFFYCIFIRPDLSTYPAFVHSLPDCHFHLRQYLQFDSLLQVLDIVDRNRFSSMTRIESIWDSWVRSFQGQTSLLSWSTLERIHWLHGCLTWANPSCLSFIRVTRVTSCSVPQNLKLEVPTPLQIQSLRLRCDGQKLAIDLSDLSLPILGN